ncbi:MAG: FMN-dependent NADH-azoreductase [Streptococcaceae bacterium]|jgi:FMN-dependent NADH-azoreductase|nr:FMN-dependent NADH-azoreductase [Streptococcaceae bacterium]
MSKVLVVKGHPLTAEGSFSLKGYDAFLESYKAANPSDEVEILDVFSEYIPEVDEHILSGWGVLMSGGEFDTLSAEQQKKIARFNALTEQFLAADKIVVVNPLWNLFIPASLKAWIDTIMVAGKTFRYTENGPVGMIEGKKLLHLQANGGVYNGQDPASQYVKTIFNFIGVTDVTQIAVEGQAYDPENAENLSNEFVAKVKEAAAKF